MSLLGWLIGLEIVDGVLDNEGEHDEQRRKNEELELELGQLRGRIEELERETKWGRGDYS